MTMRPGHHRNYTTLTDVTLGKLTSRLEEVGGADLVIVVEKLDRLSRQPPLVMTNWLQRICATGVTIATVDGRHMIDQRALMQNPFGIMSIIMEAFVGYEESKKKSDRGLENWRLKRASGRPLTARCVAWLRLSADRTHYELIAERVEIVRWICALRDQRVHKDVIARMLNERGIKPWGGGKRWWGSYIEKIVRNPALIGEHMHGTKRRSDARRVMTGEVVTGYYPAVIDAALFARINDKRRDEVANAQRKGTIANLFTKLARCSCGSIMTFRAKGARIHSDGRSVRQDYLRCDDASRGGKCSHKVSYNYTVFRDSVLDVLLHRALDDQYFQVPDAAGNLEQLVATLTRSRDAIVRRSHVAFEMAEEDPTDAHARTRYRTLRNDLKQAERALDDAFTALDNARGAVSAAEHVARVAEVREMMDHPDYEVRNEARARVKLALNDLIESCVFTPEHEGAVINLIGGLGLLIVRKCGKMLWFDLSKGEKSLAALTGSARIVAEGYVRRAA